MFGNQLADLTGPLLKLIVDSAYYGGNPIPKDPSAYRPARLFPSPGEFLATLAKVPAAIQQGLAAVSAPKTPKTPQQPESEPTGETGDTGVAEGTDEPDATEQTALDAAEGETSEQTRRPALNVVRTSEKAEPGQVGGHVGDDPADGEIKDAASQDDSTTTVDPAPTDADTDPAGAGDAGDAGDATETAGGADTAA